MSPIRNDRRGPIHLLNNHAGSSIPQSALPLHPPEPVPSYRPHTSTTYTKNPRCTLRGHPLKRSIHSLRDNTSPTITLIAGPNGSGKTRLSEALISYAWIPANAYVNPDHIARELYGDWDSAEARQKAIQHASGLIRANLKSKKSFALETVLSHSGLSLIQRAKRGGYITRL